MNTQERAILSATGYGHFLNHFNMLVFPALAPPLSQHFGLDLAVTLDLGFWMYLLFWTRMGHLSCFPVSGTISVLLVIMISVLIMSTQHIRS